MSIPVVTFFNNKGGVGKTSLVYHLAWMLSDMGYCVLACDLDPQANLTASFLPEKDHEQLQLWDVANDDPITIMQCLKPLVRTGEIQEPVLQQMSDKLYLIPGDLSLSGFEDTLSEQWPNAMGSGTDLYRSFRILTAFYTLMQKGAANCNASLILVDVGPNLGAINRSTLIATDYLVVPLGADMFSLQGLRNLGPTLQRWKDEWNKRLDNWENPEFPLPQGKMQPVGYVVQQPGIRLGRPVRAYDEWVNQMPQEYTRQLLGREAGPYPASPAEDANYLATIKHYRSLVPLAQTAHKPVFRLTSADGAIGSHAAAASDAYAHFQEMAAELVQRINLPPATNA